ncbi:hypothetical protein [Glaesserella parasuis]|uniref:hypothetical protein n=1 Tax=Glaesserella parasuis TaxID=738 RepID=UPI0007A038D5|nr:hypothetical protein [Glaesserella parasuis]AMW17517.1 hypothetical protein A4U84_10135 [Glaesserella parasuis]MCT8662948.1 hypothetical protein [Glaesserella parasuis]MCT8720591.1 hypothetical protein [Glaesserella parasuis]MCT8727616.1 hypothetical protein [Glaesserella parasuis]MDE3995184.1 hypothetical protein [Glaesserella parasuis]
MKSNFIDLAGYLTAFLIIWLFNRYILTSDLTFLLQMLILVIITIILELIYRLVQKHSNSVPFSPLWYYLVSLCVMALALGSFSQSELQQLGFNFATDEASAIRQYLLVKSLFFAIGATSLPRLLSPKINAE